MDRGDGIHSVEGDRGPQMSLDSWLHQMPAYSTHIDWATPLVSSDPA